ncbi:MoaD/ThiS family protein [Psychromonas sp. SP041]|uniref:MoaD/ThiS family protein n=1 Tax=Psychromonas sp. SP041 TaxID=1365007 RepID=UPI00040FABAE|nr:MoaD/ThiS family protein [Psychromonas sp. SP041]
MIKVLFFAKLSEQLGCRELQVDATAVENTDQLFQYLIEHKAEWSTILTSQLCLKAVNQAMVNDNVLLKDGDEVAYFPPVTGG